MSAPTARRPAVVGLLSRISLFNCFDRREREALAPLFAERSYRKGDVICREGEAGEEFFVIVSGELEVWGGGEPSRVINRLGPGDFLGEITLLAGGKRTATVTAARSAKLLALDRQAFNRFFAHNPKVLEYLSQALCKRLVETSHETGAARKCVAVSVVGRPGVKGKSLIAAVLGELIGRMSGHGTLLIRAQSSARGPQARACSLPLAELCQNPRRAIDDGLAEAGAESPGVALAVPPEVGELRLVEALTALLDALPGRFRYLIFDPGNSAGPLARACRQVSDVVVELVEGARNARLGSQRSPQSTLRVVNLHGRRAAPVPVNHCEPFLIPEDRSLRHLNLAAQVRYLRDNPWSAASPPLHRLARKILGGTVGLALGGGAAFGLAHIGVLRVLEDNAVPVDLLAGTSFGSIVALGYAAGIRPAEMIEIARRKGTVRTLLSAVDFTLSRPGFLAGDRIVRIFGPMLGSIQRFDQLRLPCRTVAADIQSGESVTIGSGRLDAAFRASCSVPMVLAPVARGGRVLVDGAIVDPVPVAAVREMGADICIAANVVPAPKRGVETALSRVLRRANMLNPLAYLAGSRSYPTMFDIIMNSIQALQSELGDFKAIAADVCIRPDLSAHAWLDFYRPMEIIARGAEAAERALPEIRRVLERGQVAASGRP